MRPLPCLPPYHAKVVLICLNNCDPGNTAEEKRGSKERFVGGLESGLRTDLNQPVGGLPV